MGKNDESSGATKQQDAAKTMRSRTPERNRRIALGLVALSAAGIWGTGRMTYVTAQVFDDKSGESVRKLVGAVWDPAATPLALAMLACLVLSLAMQPFVRRLLGALMALLAAAASFRSVMLLGAPVDLLRVHDVLVSGAATQRQSKPETIAEWAQVLHADVHILPVVLAIIAAALGVVGGVVLIMRPGEKSQGYSRYQTPEVRRHNVREDVQANPESGRVLWDALDADVDPTEDDDFHRRP